MDIALVFDCEGNLLMPTKRLGRVRHLIKDNKANIVSCKSFAIQLKYESTHFVQELYGDIVPGRNNVGVSVVARKGEVVYAANFTTHKPR